MTRSFTAADVRPSRKWLTDEPWRLHVPLQIHVLWVIAAVITAAIATWVYFGTIIAVVWGLSLMAAAVTWTRTSLHRPLSRRVVPVYVLGIVVLVVHGGEQFYSEYAATLNQMFPDFFAEPVMFTDRASFVIFPMAATVLFLLGGAALLFHHPLGNYCAWLLFTILVVIPTSHFVLAVAADEWVYVPGMWSAIAAIPLGVWGLRHLITNRTEGHLP